MEVHAYRHEPEVALKVGCLDCHINFCGPGPELCLCVVVTLNVCFVPHT